MVMGQVTKCVQVGAAVRRAKEKRQDPIVAFVNATNARKMFEGIVSSFEVEGRGGFMWGNWEINGTSECEHQSFRIWFKNENLIAWRNRKSCALCPDLICIVDSQTCEGLSNFVGEGEHNGRHVTVFWIEADHAWKTERGLKIFSPGHFGFDLRYTG